MRFYSYCRRGLLCLWLVGSVGCGHEEKELSRVRTPDGMVDALVVRKTNGGATTPFIYEVYVVKHGARAGGEPMFKAMHPCGAPLTASWDSARHLTLTYGAAEILNFSNFWYSRDVDDFRYVVRLRLRETGPDSCPYWEPPPSGA